MRPDRYRFANAASTFFRGLRTLLAAEFSFTDLAPPPINILIKIPAAAHEGAIIFAVDLAIVTFPIAAIDAGWERLIGRLKRAIDIEILVAIMVGMLAAEASAKN